MDVAVHFNSISTSGKIHRLVRLAGVATEQVCELLKRRAKKVKGPYIFQAKGKGYFDKRESCRLSKKESRPLQFPLQCNENDEDTRPQVVEEIGRGARI
jgi:hypothetical protein